MGFRIWSLGKHDLICGIPPFIEGPPDLVRESPEALEASEASSFVLRPLRMKRVASPVALRQVKLVAAELRASPLKTKQVASPAAQRQVKLVAAELRASPPKNEGSGFARGSEASEASSCGASRFAPPPE